MNETVQTKLCRLFQKWSGHWPDRCEPLPASGSDRRYFRIRHQSVTVVGAFNADLSENIAFVTFTRHFEKAGLSVPSVLAEESPEGLYLLTDLGDTTLFDWLSGVKQKEGFSDKIVARYEEVVRQLPRFQVEGARKLDFSVCYPRAAFDSRSMRWDLNYFKYYFLKLAKIPFDEQRLEDDFSHLTQLLLEADSQYFLYRDFQSRNIMIHNDSLWFIDYQGGRRGALHYDLASLLYDAKADLPDQVRTHLAECYLNNLQKLIPLDRERFFNEFYRFVLIRILQALGAYGFRGYYEQKNHFLLSIPFAVINLKQLLERGLLPGSQPELTSVLQHIVNKPELMEYGKVHTRLTVSVWSFSYKRGIPADASGNGGGYVFDCRGLPNPGRLEALKEFTGHDAPIVEYLEQQSGVSEFAQNTQSLVGPTISNYLMRGFNHLMVSFGCTGGRHRSVYMANRMAGFIRQHFDADVILRHRELELQGKE